MSKHTPGSWITDTEAIFSESGRKIAKIVGANSTETDEEFVEIEANAHLMAAAPQILEALEMADELIDQLIIDNTDNYAEERAKIRAAIVAAKGERQ